MSPVHGRRVEVEDAFISRLSSVSPLVTDAAEVAAASRDWWPLALVWEAEGTEQATASVVARPLVAAQVADVLRIANEARIPVTVAAGRSGVCGGSVPVHGGVVLDLTALDGIVAVDRESLVLDVLAGTFGTPLEEQLRAEYGVTLGHFPQSIDISTVGGWLACRGAGQKSTRYGKIEDMVTALHVVLADGRVVHTGGAPRAAVGPDLTQLFVGSEGTLGVVTAARLRLVRPATASAVALIGVRDATDALGLVRSAVPRGVRLLAAEILDAAMLRHVCDVASLPWPLAGPSDHVLLLETESPHDGAVAMDLPDDRDAVVALDAADQARLWSYRERAAEATAVLGVPHRFDVSVPMGGWDAFVAVLTARLSRLEGITEVLVFGHLADGNLHVEVLGPEPDDERADAVVLGTVAEHRGSISAEHGVGRAKAAYLHLSRSSAEIAAMRAVKGALDPFGLFNPGALLL